ncbi:hypothetical protein FNV43_RR05039 [Rhamnella rubrinervis]|uniref:F-box domain-containing protein n=1 Tax=Rhamnella rubrinervis TaxID=2594499 RepID=A0A8K0HKN0_9ROSA|nr:hypothetical protein FNV43_RR05039 [Rhamnella rubrinervis]
MDKLIDDLLIQILLRLPLIALVRFKCVCKSWYSIITSSSFIDKRFLFNHNNNTHRYVLIHSSTATAEPSFTNVDVLRYDTLHRVGLATVVVETPRFPPAPFPLIDNRFTNINVEGSCNGLLSVSVLGSDRYDIIERLIWNPATAETKVVPTSLYSSQQGDNPTQICGIGLGFDAENNDYRVVFIHRFMEGFPQSMEMEVYSLKSDTWRLLPSLMLLIDMVCAGTGALTNNNGMYSWLTVNERDDNGAFLQDTLKGEIVSFEMSSEVIIRTCLPDDITNPLDYVNYIMVYDGSLAIASRIKIDGSSFDGEDYEIWVLRELGVQYSWSKLFSIGPIQNTIQCLGFWKDDGGYYKMFFELDIENDPPTLARRDAKLSLHDHLTEQTLDLPVFGIGMTMWNYQDSLVSIKYAHTISN